MSTLPKTFWSKVDKTDACWIWTGAVQSSGYGSVGIGNRRTALVHRLSYEAHVGPIPDGYTIDHVVARGCTDKRCVRPDHLEPVTIAENNRRGRVARGYFVGGQCSKGHRLAGDNVRISRRRLVCRECKRLTRDQGNHAIREWARENAIEIADRGPISPAIRLAYRVGLSVVWDDYQDALAFPELYGTPEDVLAHWTRAARSASG